MNFLLRNIPNLITCLNLICGGIGIILVLENRVEMGCLLVFLAAFFDFLDGMAARSLKVSSTIGKDLDSLADLVSFGLLPGIMVYVFLRNSLVLQNQMNFASIEETELRFLPFIGLIIPVFSAIRLAKFNNDLRQKDSFIGLPTPANAIFISSLAINIHQSFRALKSGQTLSTFDASFLDLVHAPIFWVILSVISAILLVSPLPLFSLKFKNLAWSGNSVRYIFLTLSLALLITFKLAGLPLIIILYLFLSILIYLWKGRKQI
jgi:CDP-diacylglycerol--serine O-phosphatidyltransferase